LFNKVDSLISQGLLGTIGNTPLIELKNISPKVGVRFFVKLEGNNPTGSVKDRIAKKMIETAEESGKLSPGKVILEPTSGNTGISLAMIGRLKGYKVKVVMPENVSIERIQLLKAYGADIHLSEPNGGTNHSVQVAKRLADSNPNYFMPYQYGNPSNPDVHFETTGPEIIRDLPNVTHFVAGLGTGGTLMGVGRYLKQYNPEIKVIAATPQPDELIYGLRDLDEGFVPPILDLNMLDSRILVNSDEAFHWTSQLLKLEGVFAGVSSGAVIATARKLSERLSEANVVCLLADAGWKYLSTSLWTKDSADLEHEVGGKIWW